MCTRRAEFAEPRETIFDPVLPPIEQDVVVGSCDPSAACRGDEEPPPPTAGTLVEATPTCREATYCVPPALPSLSTAPLPPAPVPSYAPTSRAPSPSTSASQPADPSSCHCSAAGSARGRGIVGLVLAIVVLAARRRSRRVALVALSLCGVASHASAQPETRELASGWSATTGLARMRRIFAVACGDERAYAVSWEGGVAAFDGREWTALPELPRTDDDPFRGRRIALGAHGVIVEGTGGVASWDGRGWTLVERHEHPYGWSGDISVIDGAIYEVGPAYVARSVGGSPFVRYDAGWRDLHAIGGTSASDVWVGGQGGTLMHWDGRAWTRTASGTEEEIDGLVVVYATDVWAWSRDRDVFRTAPVILHWDGAAWSSMAPPDGLESIAVRGERVWALTRERVLERGSTGWTPVLAIQFFSEPYRDTLTALCATRTHLVVGAATGTVVTRPL